MAHKTSDGKRSFTNASQARKYDKRNAAPSEGARMAEPQGDLSNEEQDGVYGSEGDMGDGGSDGAAMAQEHGPAHKVTIQSDEGSGMHNAIVEHPDGHSHQSQHGSAAEAHKFGADCAGV